MQGIKHALAYTKSSEVISSALALLKVLDSPQLITQVWFFRKLATVFEIIKYKTQ